MPIKSSFLQLINGFVIFSGAILLLYTIINEDANVLFKVFGVILIMFGAYRASSHWVEHKDDHLSEEEE
ncbi:hypothetical protein [uncultured Nonlabens sp.]|uniref:hypothetical protein n=1 Tax=uncultured Nonlabens sp. TaxID=859306 RepID=UPI00262E06E5|nr:hypothetical protein [uncultured Nonlabens sp.]